MVYHKKRHLRHCHGVPPDFSSFVFLYLLRVRNPRSLKATTSSRQCPVQYIHSDYILESASSFDGVAMEPPHRYLSKTEKQAIVYQSISQDISQPDDPYGISIYESWLALRKILKRKDKPHQYR